MKQLQQQKEGKHLLSDLQRERYQSAYRLGLMNRVKGKLPAVTKNTIKLGVQYPISLTCKKLYPSIFCIYNY